MPGIEATTFMRSDMIDNEGRFIPPPDAEDEFDAMDSKHCPDLEIMIVSATSFIQLPVPYVNTVLTLMTTPKVLSDGDSRRPGLDKSRGIMGFLISILKPASTQWGCPSEIIGSR